MPHTETFFRFGLWESTGVGYFRPNESSQWRSPDLHLHNGFNFFCYLSLSMSYFSWNFSIAKFVSLTTESIAIISLRVSNIALVDTYSYFRNPHVRCFQQGWYHNASYIRGDSEFYMRILDFPFHELAKWLNPKFKFHGKVWNLSLWRNGRCVDYTVVLSYLLVQA